MLFRSTLPFASTEATDSAELLQVMVLSVTLAGVIVAFSSADSPSVNVISFGSMLMLSGSITLFTITAQVAVILLPSVVFADIVQEPSATLVTLPMTSTMATASSELLHKSFLLKAVAGVIVEVICCAAPMLENSSCVGDSVRSLIKSLRSDTSTLHETSSTPPLPVNDITEVYSSLRKILKSVNTS